MNINPKIPKFEYKTMLGGADYYAFNKLGEQGWELVTHSASVRGDIDGTFIFKRPILPESTHTEQDDEVIFTELEKDNE